MAYLFEVNDGSEMQVKPFDSLDEAKEYATRVWGQLDSDNKEVLELFCIEELSSEPDGEFSFNGEIVWTQDELVREGLKKLGATVGEKQDSLRGIKVYGVCGTPEVLSAARKLLVESGYYDDTLTVKSDLTRGIGEIRISVGGDAGFGGFVCLPVDVKAFCDAMGVMVEEAKQAAEEFGVCLAV